MELLKVYHAKNVIAKEAERKINAGFSFYYLRKFILPGAIPVYVFL